ncbi:MipA/OmpV family protein [Acidihalobacter ferrooxydans]|uniref:MipA/OmpV family protein n=1 Tax=Acidihalobacter ferrooxydans TaxID=1765967 RepID=A0A1P8UDX1_9GAMM|nr:MipA/OmpV family protein [Acidihalobacter ferrooxydans]APZ42062.1 hypothetical protein BW247_02250 [Acidihalobacter ferrooxydans]
MRRILTILCLGLLPALAEAGTNGKPLWELGAGTYLLSLPAYPGATEYQTYLLPFPFVIYRGQFLRADRHGIRGVFFASPRLSLSLSATASPPVSSAHVPIRRGMPNLQPTFEVGPQLKLHLYRTPQATLDLRLAIRSVQTLRLTQIGWVAAPYLNLNLPDWRDSGWNLGLALGPDFGDRGYHRYFYDVAPQYATANRPTYRAPAGYSGTNLYLAANRRFGRFWVGGFLHYDSLQGAVFEHSPLVRTRRYLSAGVGVAWIFAQSTQRAAPAAAHAAR